MSLMDKATDFVNKTMNAKAFEILNEVKDEINNGHRRTGKTADSFQIMGTSESSGAQISRPIETGGRLIKSVIIGSNYRPALWLNDGNAQSGSPIKPHTAPYLKFQDTRGGKKGGKAYRLPQVSTYSGIHYIEKVAARHKGA